MTSPKLLCLASFALAISAAHAATTIFSHTFNEGTGNLNGTAVDTGTGNWVAANVVTANGVFSTDQGSATLAFVPSNGYVYTLDARILDITGTNANWVAVGFANGQSVASSGSTRFTNTTVSGTAWSLVRGNNGTFGNVSFNSSGALASSGGTNDPAPINWPAALNNNGGSIDLRIVLNTTLGTGQWTVNYFAKLTTETDYTTLGSANVLSTSQANYTSVGFGFGNADTDGTLASFSLTAIPEPSAALLGGLGLLALLRRRR